MPGTAVTVDAQCVNMKFNDANAILIDSDSVVHKGTLERLGWMEHQGNMIVAIIAPDTKMATLFAVPITVKNLCEMISSCSVEVWSEEDDEWFMEMVASRVQSDEDLPECGGEHYDFMPGELCTVCGYACPDDDEPEKEDCNG